MGAAKRARYRKYGSATLAFGISALSLLASSRDKSTSSALQTPMVLWQALCINPRVERDQPLE
jgi:hypothetical protein